MQLDTELSSTIDSDAKAKPIEVTVTILPEVSGYITVKYVDTEGNQISDDILKSGIIGEDYTTEKQEIAGYTFKEVQGDPTGKFTNQEQTVIYIYTKDKENVVTPVPNSKPEEPSNEGSQENKKSNTSKVELPALGESNRLLFNIIGMILIAFIGIVLLFNKRTQKE
ncbi:MucBP domain-containing protein [Enterococcus termitis]